MDVIEVDGYMSKKPIRLFWRDGLEVVKWIFGNPIFAHDISYNPKQVFCEEGREYTEFMTADYVWACQVRAVLLVPLDAFFNNTTGSITERCYNSWSNWGI
jgi:hypothetical protein